MTLYKALGSDAPRHMYLYKYIYMYSYCTSGLLCSLSGARWGKLI